MSMDAADLDLTALLPLIVLAASAVVVMLAIAWLRCHALAALLCAAGLGLTLAVLPLAWERAPQQVTPLFAVDGLALLFTGILCAASLVITLLAHGYFRDRPGQREELYLLLLLATLGGVVLAGATHFASLFLGVELLSIALYALIAYPRSLEQAVEAGLKYVILAAASSAFLLFGLALVYAQQGTMEIQALGAQIGRGQGSPQLLSLAGLGLVITGIGFKLALVPFHLWTPEVYAGAPAPVTAFIATVSKAGMVAVTLRLLHELQAAGSSMFLALGLIAVASMIVGNLLALLQDNVKRLLAYSSIAHLGYLLVALLATGELAVEAAIYYITAYVVTILVAFGVVTLLSTERSEPETLDSYRGLFWRRPWVATLFVASLLSLAGIPLTAGFLGKFYVLLAGVESELWLLVLTLVLGSAIGLFYYLRVIVALFSAEGELATAARPGWLSVATLSALGIPLLWLGVYPQPFVELIRALVSP